LITINEVTTLHCKCPCGHEWYEEKSDVEPECPECNNDHNDWRRRKNRTVVDTRITERNAMRKAYG